MRLCTGFGRAVLILALVGAGGSASAAPPAAPGDVERAGALIRAREFGEALAVLRHALTLDPANRQAREMLAFAFESSGDLADERRTRAALVNDFPDDARLHADYGRVLERSGEDAEALREYQRARALDPVRIDPDLDRAVERTRGRTSVEVASPASMMSDPDARASTVQGGVALPFAARGHVAIVGSRTNAEARGRPGATTTDAIALSFVRGGRGGAYVALEPRVHVVAPAGGTRRDVGAGGSLAGRVRLGAMLEAEARADAVVPWDEAATAMLHGGRTSAVEGHLYAHALSDRLLLQAGARRRELSILDGGPTSLDRARARQSLWLGGGDVVLWRKPGASVRGEMLDERMIAPSGLSPAVVLAYRHYDVATDVTPEFGAVIGVAPRGSVDEGSIATTLASPRRDLGIELEGGLAHDSARGSDAWRGGGGLIWAPWSTTRLALHYDAATEVASGLTGTRHAGWMSVHVDL